MYTKEQEARILSLIQQRRHQLREEKTDLKRAGELSERQGDAIQSELDDLHDLEITNRGHRLI